MRQLGAVVAGPGAVALGAPGGGLSGRGVLPWAPLRATVACMRGTSAVAEAEAATDERELARRAGAGDGAAFATLYDRHERAVYNFCYRLIGSPEDAADATQDAFLKVLERLPELAAGDRELNFAAYLMTVARHAAYRLMEERKRTEPVDELPEGAVPVGMGGGGGGAAGGADPGDPHDDPERRVLLEAQQEEVRAANARLPERQREALALRELEELSYDEIAEVMGMNRNSVAQLISRARVNLRDELRGSALASVAPASPECERAAGLIAMRDDDQLPDGDERAWLARHIAGCGPCRVRVEAIAEAGASYRAWTPLVPLFTLRKETIALAGERVGADWSEFASSPRGSHDHPGGGGNGGAGGGQPVPGGAPDGAGGVLPGGIARRLREMSRRRRNRIGAGLLALLLLLALGGGGAALLGGGDGPGGKPEPASSTSGDPASSSATAPPLGGGAKAGGDGDGGGDAGAPGGDSPTPGAGGAPGSAPQAQGTGGDDSSDPGDGSRGDKRRTPAREPSQTPTGTGDPPAPQTPAPEPGPQEPPAEPTPSEPEPTPTPPSRTEPPRR